MTSMMSQFQVIDRRLCVVDTSSGWDYVWGFWRIIREL
jgi:hypothetical protein